MRARILKALLSFSETYSKYKNNIKINKNTKSILLSFSILILLILFANNKYILSDMVIQDDNIYLSRALLGEASLPSQGILGYVLIDILATFDSIVAIKFMVMLFYGVAGAAICTCLLVAGLNRWLSLATAIFIASFPLASEQEFFVTGAHPIMGTSMALLALIAFFKPLALNQKLGFADLTISTMFACLAVLFSPTMILFPFAPLLWLSLAAGGRRIAPKRFGLLLGLLVIPATAIAIITLRTHHYNQLVGWTDFSLSTVLHNLKTAVSYIIGAAMCSGAGGKLFYLGLLMVLLAMWIAGRSARKKIPSRADSALLLALMALAAAALSFGPGSVNVNYLERYTFGAFVFSALSAAAFLLYGFDRQWTGRTKAAVIVLLSLTALNLWGKHRVIEKQYANGYAGHLAVKKLIAAESSKWPRDAQILIILKPPLTIFTGGYNHWSTWYVRGLTRRKDLIAVVGQESLITQTPFVSRYADHSPNYWIIEHNRSQRLRMIGLEAQRPLFSYVVSGGKKSHFKPVNTIFRSSHQIAKVSPGSAPSQASVSDARTGNACTSVALSTFIWPVAVDIPGVHRTGIQASADQRKSQTRASIKYNSRLEFDGKSATTVRLTFKAGQCVSFRIVLAPTRKVQKQVNYSDNYPPMPLRGPQVALYQLPEQMRIMHGNSGGLSLKSSNGVTELHIVGIEGEDYRLEQVGNSYPLDTNTLSGEWILGKGFLERFWQGVISYRIEVDGKDVTQ